MLQLHYTTTIAIILIGVKSEFNFKEYVAVFTCAIYLFIPSTIVQNAIIWITGSFNYLLPFCGLMFIIYAFTLFFMDKKLKYIDYILAVVGCLLGCYAEQTGAVIAVLGLFIISYKVIIDKKKDNRIIIIYVFALINVCIQYLAPGNQVRAQAETLKWYNSYDMLNVFDKFILGLVYIVKEIFTEGKIFPIILSLILLFVVRNRDRFTIIITALVFCINIFMPNMLGELPDNVITNIYDMKQLFVIFYIVVWLLMESLVIVNAIPNLKCAIVSMLLFLASICAGVVMGFSPTVYASGTRVFLSVYLLFSMVIVIIFSYSFLVKSRSDTSK